VKDGDCRTHSDGRVFCHTERTGIKGKKCESNEIYIYLGESTEGQGAGMWKIDEPTKTYTAKAPREYGIRYFDYFFWDGSPTPAQRYRKDVEGQPKQIGWCRGGLGGRPQSDVAPYRWQKIKPGERRIHIVRGELKAELLSSKGFPAISVLNQKDELLVAELKARQCEIVLVPDCDEADLEKWFAYLSAELPKQCRQLLAPGLPWSNPPADGGLGIEDWIYAKNPSITEISGAVSAIEEIDEHKRDLNKLKEAMVRLTEECEDEFDRVELAKKKASELGFSIQANTLKIQMNSLSYQTPTSYNMNNAASLQSEPKLWGDLLLFQSSNLLIAPPKVGKTALMIHLAGCMYRRETHCLGQPIHSYCDHLIIYGNDMALNQWSTLLIREGLAKVADGLVHFTPFVSLYAKGNSIQLSPPGIKNIVRDCKKNPNPMVLIDTYRSQTSSLDLKENEREAARPLEDLMSALAAAKCKTTIVCLHHAKKSGGATAVDASSGHGAIPAAFDQTIDMAWLAGESIGQRDKRIVVSSSGRGSQDQSIVVELVGQAPARWVSYGDAEALLEKEAIATAEEALTTQCANIYDHVQTFYENTGKGTTAKQIREQFQISKQAAHRRLLFLCRKGLLIKVKGCGSTELCFAPYYAERVEQRSSSSSSLPSADFGGRSDLKGAIDPPSKSAVLGGRPPSKTVESPSEACGKPSEALQENGSQRSALVRGDFSLKPLALEGGPACPPISLSSSSSLGLSTSLYEKENRFLMAESNSNERALHANDLAIDDETLKPQLDQRVSVFRGGKWESGWSICDSRNPHSLRVRIERDGKSQQLANQRWGIDVRPEPLELSTSPRKEGLGVIALDTSSEDLGRASKGVEMPVTDAQEDSFF
jgi:hypothetical protein